MKLRIRFDPPGWFAIDGVVAVRLDDTLVYEGSFLAGFSVETDAAPGAHKLVVAIRLGPFGGRTKSYSIEMREPREGDSELVLQASLRYSRMWGTFDKQITLEERRIDEVEPPTPPTPPPAPRQPIRATWALLFVLAACYAAEWIWPISPAQRGAPSVATLIAFGGLTADSVAQGEWYRLLSCVFLHASPLHIILNGVALAMAGVLIEGMVGWRWLLALFFVGSIGGSAMSLALNDGHMVSVGASGAVMALFAAGLFLAATLPDQHRAPTQFQLLRVLIPSLLPIIPRSGERIDLGAHIGGAIVGALAGWLLLVAIRRRERAGKREAILASPLALAGSGALVLGAAGALWSVAVGAYPETRDQLAAEQALLPNDELPEGSATPEELTDWLAHYPDDPRVHTFAAERDIEREQWDAALEHIAQGRRDLVRYGDQFPAANRALIAQGFTHLEGRIALRRELIPNSEWPVGTDAERDAAWDAHLAEWMRRFPNDPRVCENAAWAALDAGANDEAEEHARAGAEQLPRFTGLLSQEDAMARLHLVRAIALLRLHRVADAAPLLSSLCGGAEGESAQRAATNDALCPQAP